MRAVLYAKDMEPITVINLPPTVAHYLERYGRVRVPVALPALPWVAGTSPTYEPLMRTVDIFAERLVRHGRETLMLFTRDEENALLLKCAFLPGQQAGLQELEREHYVKGFAAALNLACGG